MKVYAFAVPGTPIPWKRARRRGAVTFTDPKDALHREKIRAFARNAGLRRRTKMDPRSSGTTVMDLVTCRACREWDIRESGATDDGEDGTS